MASKTINSATNTELGDAGAGGDTKKVIQIVSSSFVGTITVKARATGSGAAYVPISYKKHYLNGAVADETYVSTGITGTSLIEVPASGLDISLDTTAAYTSGTMTVYTQDVRV